MINCSSTGHRVPSFGSHWIYNMLLKVRPGWLPSLFGNRNGRSSPGRFALRRPASLPTRLAPPRRVSTCPTLPQPASPHLAGPRLVRGMSGFWVQQIGFWVRQMLFPPRTIRCLIAALSYKGQPSWRTLGRKRAKSIFNHCQQFDSWRLRRSNLAVVVFWEHRSNYFKTIIIQGMLGNVIRCRHLGDRFLSSYIFRFYTS